MCSPIRFTRPGARTTCTGPEGAAPNARANAAPRWVEAMRLEISRKDRSFAPAALRMTGLLASRVERNYPRICCLRRRQLAHGTTRGLEVRELHLGILARQEHPMGASLERRPHG